MSDTDPRLAARKRIWRAQHDANCEASLTPHPWTDHLLWESEEYEAAAIAEADAILAALPPCDFDMQRLTNAVVRSGYVGGFYREAAVAIAREYAALGPGGGAPSCDHAAELDRLRALSEAATPGPWAWFHDRYETHLATVDRGRVFVMGFARRGMNGAQPTFQVRDAAGNGYMKTAAEIGDLRMHPDAALIVAAVNFLRAALEPR